LTRIRACVLVLALILVLPAAVAGCGGDGGGGGEDPGEVLDQTFNNPEGITSGQVSISLVSGTLTATIEGPFQTDKDNPAAFPQLDLSVQINASGASQPVDFDGGLVATKDNAFVEYQGQAYEVGSSYFQRFQRVYQRLGRQAQARRRNSSASSIFERLGIDPQTWLTNLSNEGEETVEGTETIHVRGDADVEQIVSDVGRIAQRAPGGAAQAVDPAQLERVESAIQDASLDVYSGKDDRILRKLSLSLDIVPPEGAGGSAASDVTVDFSLTLSDVNGPQAISGPSSAEPISGLLSGLGLGDLGLPGPPNGSGGGGGGGTSSDYLTCIEDATTPAEINECASQL
jgi:hypothetical protein